jgi:hypothetical protein
LQWEDIVQCDAREREKEKYDEETCKMERGDYYDNNPNNPPPWW